jgi:hypothetical protein
MKLSLQAINPVVGMAIGLIWAMASYAQQGGPSYQAPNFSAFSAAGGHYSGRPVQGPMMPASPLAGGMSAARGDAFMDAHGNRIVMPAAYCADCQGGDGGYSMGAPGGCFSNGGCASGCQSDMPCSGYGGCGVIDQCGPHYFDISADMVYLTGDDLFAGVPAFTSEGAGGVDHYLAPTDYDDFEPGWRIALRYDLGPLSVFEATYMGLYDMAFDDQVRSVDVTDPSTDFQLFSVFSDYGIGTLIPGVDDGSVHRLDYESDLQSTELTYRTYWTGVSPRVTGTLLVGARYLRLTDQLAYNTTALVGVALGSATRIWSGENDLVGAQFGGDGWICLRQGLRIGGEGKAGIYNNHFQFNHAGDLPGAGSDFSSRTSGDQVAFAAEGSLMAVADILPSLSLRGGYQLLYINSLVTAGNNIDPSNYSSTSVSSQADALYHGFHVGAEYIW